MAEVVIPEIKHEYIRQVDTETTKDDWFDECIADNKEAAWAGIGTSENDSQYQPAPSVEPDYYMQYCSSDDYDYLKDYRLIWGYGIGIIEQDVICSLSTGEHLAEGKDACDTYATENAAGENTDWKRGTWIKFSGNRNVSPTRIGEVILPERVISLKDLCGVIKKVSQKDLVVEGFNTEHIINMDNMFVFSYNSAVIPVINGTYDLTNCLTAKKSFGDKLDCSNTHFINLNLNCDYSSFLYTSTISNFDDFKNYAIGGSYMFYNVRITNDYDGLLNNSVMKLYSNMFNHIITDKILFQEGHNANFTCSENVETCFNHPSLQNNYALNTEVLPNVNFENCTDASAFGTFNVSKSCIFDYSTLDSEKANTYQLLYIDTNNSICITIIPPNKYHSRLNTVFITNSDKDITLDFKNILYYCKGYGAYQGIEPFINGCSKVIGTFYGTSLFNVELKEGSNVIIKNEIDTVEKFKEWIEDNNNINCIEPIFVTNDIEELSDDLYTYINADDYLIVNNMALMHNYNANESMAPTYKLYNINHTFDRRGKDAIILHPTIIQRHDITVDVDNTSNIFICSYDSYVNNYKCYLDITEHNRLPYININNVESEPITIDYKIYQYNYCQYDYYMNGNTLNAPNGNINCDGNIVMIADNLNSVSINSSFKIVANNCKTFNINSNVVTNSYFYLGNINWTINTDYKVIANVGKSFSSNKYLIRNIGESTESEYYYINNKSDIHFPSIIPITLSERNADGLIGNFVDTPYSELLYRVEWANERNYLMRFEQYANETLIKDEVPNNTFKQFNNYFYNGNVLIKEDFYDYDLNLANNYSESPTIGKKENYLISIGNVTISNKNSGQHINYTYLNYVQRIKSIRIAAYIDDFYLNHYLDTNFTISVDASKRIDNFHTTSEASNITNFIVTGNKPQSDFNLSYLDKLTQECINNIVDVTGFVSGCTLTINTIPFQYITEEQKQALTDAGVTLVEYIPTETTE